MPIKTLTATVDAEQAGRVDLVLRAITETSRSQVRGMVDRGCVQINDIACQDSGAMVQEGDRVSVRYDPSQRYRETKKRWDDRTFSIVFEDEHLIVVDKAAGTLTVPTDHHEPNTLVERVSVYLSHSRGERDAHVVHRLDRDVSGLLVMGKTEKIATKLIEQFKLRKPQRLYTAIVAGLVPNDEGVFDSHLATGKNLDRYVTAPSKGAEQAITHYRVLQRMTDATLVEVRLETGKRNQIRVQFAHAGHPVLGDPRYETEKAVHRRWIRKRIALHARSLGFDHPVTGKPVSLESSLPAAIVKFINGSKQIKKPAARIADVPSSDQ